MKKIFVVGNWKCNPQTLFEAKRIFGAVSKMVKKRKFLETIVCPPFIFIPALKGKKVKLGAQDCFWEGKGPFTGEISPDQLKSLGAEYVILGHSERRRWQKETDLMINMKVKAVLSAGLKAILCVEKKSQLEGSLNGINDFNNLLVAFEPVSAIGTGKPYDVNAARKMNLIIRKKIKKNIPILYGGSVNSGNARDYIEKAGFDGFLVGGASLNPEEFVRITQILI